jgi:thioredoxin reductase (NADPH)
LRNSAVTRGQACTVSWGDQRTGIETTHRVRNLFVFIGADPETEWLDDCGVVLDAHGFVVTGAPVQAAEGRVPVALESSVPGVYAVGDVRSGSVKARRWRHRRRWRGGGAHPRAFV